jgi:hypothetical protein
MNSTRLRNFYRNNFVENITKQMTQAFLDKANCVLLDILVLADEENLHQFEQEISEIVKKKIDKKYVERCISIIIPEEFEKAKRDIDLVIQ